MPCCAGLHPGAARHAVSSVRLDPQSGSTLSKPANFVVLHVMLCWPAARCRPAAGHSVYTSDACATCHAVPSAQEMRAHQLVDQLHCCPGFALCIANVVVQVYLCKCAALCATCWCSGPCTDLSCHDVGLWSVMEGSSVRWRGARPGRIVCSHRMCVAMVSITTMSTCDLASRCMS
jgi:hypothetical protein